MEKNKSATNPITCGRVNPDIFKSDDVAKSCPVSSRRINQYGGITLETFQYTHFSSSHPLSVKKGFIKGEILRLLRTNSVKEIFELRKLEFLTCLLERGYPRELAENILAEVKFSSRNEALQNKTKTSRNVLPFITIFSPATPNLKKVLMKRWNLITESNRPGQTYSEPPIVAYRKDKSLKDLLVRAKIPSHI